jgi:hypothetical protein
MMAYTYVEMYKSMDFKVFDRWGKKCLSTNPTVGWDGLPRASDTDVFVYYLIAEDYYGTKVELKGNVTLMH